MSEVVFCKNYLSFANTKHYLIFFLIRINQFYCSSITIKSVSAIVVYWLFVHSNPVNALSASTENAIHGHAPYLTFDNGKTKVVSVEGLLGLQLSDGRSFIAAGGQSDLYPNAIIDDSSQESPIDLLSDDDTFLSIKTLVPLVNNSSYPSISLSNLITSSDNYWGDEDGDASPNATGNLMVKWLDANNNDITTQVKNNPNAQLTGCDSPYKLTITSNGGQLFTQYGIPNVTDFSGAKHTYYFNRKIDTPYVCYVQPNVWYDGRHYPDADGPDWIRSRGFKVQDISNPDLNFPTTGLNGLNFYLILGGVTPEQVITANTQDGQTVYPVNGGNKVTISLKSEQTPGWDNSPKVLALKVVLNGPNENSTDTSFSPVLFKIYADSERKQLLYSFNIDRWYIASSNDATSNDDVQRFCDNLGNGYRFPKVNDLTNANGKGWHGGINGRNINNYRRQISFKDASGKWIGGIFNEWGSSYQLYYPTSDWHTSTQSYYWALSDDASIQYAVGSDVGDIDSDSTAGKMVCVNP